MSRFATRVWELENGRITDFKGTYEKYRAMKAAAPKTVSAPREGKPEKKEKPRRPASVDKQLAKLEREISALEESLRRITEQKNEFGSDYEKLLELDRGRG